MTNEIKEILDTLKYCVEKNEYLEVPNMKEWKPLLDYITNLQEEKKRLLESADCLSKGYSELEQRIDKAIEKIINDSELIDLEDGYDTCMKVIDILRGEE